MEYFVGTLISTTPAVRKIPLHTAPRSLSTLTVCDSKFFTFHNSLKQKQSDLHYHSNSLCTNDTITLAICLNMSC